MILYFNEYTETGRRQRARWHGMEGQGHCPFSSHAINILLLNNYYYYFYYYYFQIIIFITDYIIIIITDY